MAKEYFKYSLPDNWTWVELEQILETTSGGTPSRKRQEYYQGKIPWVKSGELNYNTIFDTEEKVTEAAIANSSAKIFPKGTLLIALYGATVGRLAFLGVDASTNQAVCGIFNNKNIDLKFIYYCLMHQYSHLISLSAGGAQPNISQAIIKKLNIPLPPFNEQNRIVLKLDELFSELEKGKEQLKTSLEQLRVFRKSVLHSAIEGKHLIKKYKWFDKTLGDVISISSGSGLTRAKRNDDGDFLVYGGNGVTGKHTSFMFEKEQLIIGRVGAQCGNAHITKPKSWVTDNAFIVTFNNEDYNIKFLYYLIWYLELNKYSSSTAQPVISQGKLYPIEIRIPEIDTQIEIVEFIDSQFSICDNTEKTILQNLSQSDLLKQSLLQKAFEGSLVDQDPNDEPASVLLNRIKKERAAFLTVEVERKKKDKPIYIKIYKMAEELKSILTILQESKAPVSSKTLWQSSVHKDDIDEFYAELKKHIEKGEVIELPREGKESFLKVKEAQ